MNLVWIAAVHANKYISNFVNMGSNKNEFGHNFGLIKHGLLKYLSYNSFMAVIHIFLFSFNLNTVTFIKKNIHTLQTY